MTLSKTFGISRKLMKNFNPFIDISRRETLVWNNMTEYFFDTDPAPSIDTLAAAETKFTKWKSWQEMLKNEKI